MVDIIFIVLFLLQCFGPPFRWTVTMVHAENINAEITRIWAILTFDHGFAMHHSLEIVKIALEVLLCSYQL